MLMESANKGIKDAIRHIDRCVMRRVIEALWLYNMQYSDDPSIKGDVNVVARGSSAMLIREQTSMLRQQFLQLTGNDMDMGILGMEGRRKLLDSVAEKLDMPGLIPTQEQMEQNLAQQQKAQQAKLEAEQQLEQAKGQAEVAVKQAQAKKYGADAAETQADTQIAQQQAPLDAQHLLAEIAKLIAETQGKQNERAAVESPVANQQQPGRQMPVGNAQVPARGLSRLPGAMPGYA
jgi:hypothetical protein